MQSMSIVAPPQPSGARAVAAHGLSPSVTPLRRGGDRARMASAPAGAGTTGRSGAGVAAGPFDRARLEQAQA